MADLATSPFLLETRTFAPMMLARSLLPARSRPRGLAELVQLVQSLCRASPILASPYVFSISVSPRLVRRQPMPYTYSPNLAAKGFDACHTQSQRLSQMKLVVYLSVSGGNLMMLTRLSSASDLGELTNIPFICTSVFDHLAASNSEMTPTSATVSSLNSPL